MKQLKYFCKNVVLLLLCVCCRDIGNTRFVGRNKFPSGSDGGKDLGYKSHRSCLAVAQFRPGKLPASVRRSEWMWSGARCVSSHKIIFQSLQSDLWIHLSAGLLSEDHTLMWLLSWARGTPVGLQREQIRGKMRKSCKLWCTQVQCTFSNLFFCFKHINRVKVRTLTASGISLHVQ